MTTKIILRMPLDKVFHIKCRTNSRQIVGLKRYHFHQESCKTLSPIHHRFWLVIRAVIKSWGPGISPGYYECGPGLLLLENRRKLEPKETPRCLIPRLLVVFTRQLEILATTLGNIIIICNIEPNKFAEKNVTNFVKWQGLHCLLKLNLFITTLPCTE